MKAILCGASGSIHINSFRSVWTPCECGNCRAMWIDPSRGTVVVAARDRSVVRLLGLNNAYLLPAFTATHPNWETMREWHTMAVNAPGFIFDESKASCWAVVLEIGRSSDVRWASDAEYEAAFR